jgi:hypothetical protein
MEICGLQAKIAKMPKPYGRRDNNKIGPKSRQREPGSETAFERFLKPSYQGG